MTESRKIQTTKFPQTIKRTSEEEEQPDRNVRQRRLLLSLSGLVVLLVTLSLVILCHQENSKTDRSKKPFPSSSLPESSERLSTRAKRSPLVSSSSTFAEGSTGPASLYLLSRFNEMNEENALNDIGNDPSAVCRKRSLPMCRGQVPFNSTTYPNFIGDSSELEASRSLPYFNYIAKSRCNRRIKQLLCSFLEPDCQNGRPVPPCKKFCRIALEGCAEFVPQTLELSAAFDCRRYPDSTDPRVCTNLAVGPKCAADEFQCPDRSCIPNHWLCDGVRDCIFAADEANCNTVGEFTTAVPMLQEG